MNPSKIGKVGAALLAVMVLWPWPSFSQTTTLSPGDFVRRPLVKSEQAQKDQATDRDAEFKEILALVDQIEAKWPGGHEMLSKLRGKLFKHERNLPVFDIEADRDTVAGDSRKARARRTRGDTPPYSANLYAVCAGLRNRELVEQLQDISEVKTSVDYTQARRLMFTKIDNFGGEVECVYTGRKGRYNSIPNDRDMNCEHTWPQSQGATGVAKSDLFHLFPTDSKANSTRSSLPFGPVSHPSWEEGGSKCDGDVFEVRKEHRGNVARAKFYFAVRYGKHIPRDEEEALRAWHKEDPVDAAERERCNQIENIQHNRNPFIDHPEYVDEIDDF